LTLFCYCHKEYDPETAFVEDDAKDEEENAPYDPEDNEELLPKEGKSREVEELVEKQVRFLFVKF